MIFSKFLSIQMLPDKMFLNYYSSN